MDGYGFAVSRQMCQVCSVNCMNSGNRETFENINFRKSISIYIVIIIKKKEDCVSLYDKEFTLYSYTRLLYREKAKVL